MDTRLAGDCYCGYELCLNGFSCHNDRPDMNGGSAGSVCVYFFPSGGVYDSVGSIFGNGICSFGDNVEFCH